MIIVPATRFDIEGIADCAERFFLYADYESQGMPLNREDFKDMVLSNYIMDESGLALLLKDDPCGKIRGGIAGRMSAWGYNRSIKIMVELFYWVDQEYRGLNSIRLIDKFEKESFKKGANKVVMISINTDLKDGVDRLYKKRGFEHFEQFFIKGGTCN